MGGSGPVCLHNSKGFRGNLCDSHFIGHGSITIARTYLRKVVPPQCRYPRLINTPISFKIPVKVAVASNHETESRMSLLEVTEERKHGI